MERGPSVDDPVLSQKKQDRRSPEWCVLERLGLSREYGTSLTRAINMCNFLHFIILVANV